MSDLNAKKSWNPKSLKNQAKIWAREKEALDEFKKIKQRQEEINKTKEFADNGYAPKSKTSWIYEHDDKKLEATDEDYLLGKRRLDSKLLKKEQDPIAKLDKFDRFAKVERQEAPADKLDKNDPMYKFKLEQLKRKELLELKEKLQKESKHSSASRSRHSSSRSRHSGHSSSSRSRVQK